MEEKSKPFELLQRPQYGENEEGNNWLNMASELRTETFC